ncbi:Polyadenylate-binding protein 4 [Galemys pyrenaicus]|uniref:Polyadenylate-binding protein 4 n=1 Tax=Galemys pyrenaicus TaxID=202257 RepID=A0A8J6DU30_GALPY|nr:Polyadenylate-binding protein 4 [Galemys pyrenaicus]
MVTTPGKGMPYFHNTNNNGNKFYTNKLTNNSKGFAPLHFETQRATDKATVKMKHFITRIHKFVLKTFGKEVNDESQKKQFGKTENVKVLKDASGKPKVTGSVSYEKHEGAKKVMEERNGKVHTKVNGLAHKAVMEMSSNERISQYQGCISAIKTWMTLLMMRRQGKSFTTY